MLFTHVQKHNSVKRLLCILFAVSVVSMSIVVTSASSFAADGTPESPIMISSCAELIDVNDDMELSYRLSQSLDCTEDGNDIAIGDADTYFEGDFDGDGFTITMSLSSESTSYFGLFSQIGYDASVHDLHLAGLVHGHHTVGALAGYVYLSNVDNITSTVEVSGDAYVGGLVGQLEDSNIIDSSTSGDIAGSDDNVGGIVGSTEGASTLSNVNSSSQVEGLNFVGGIAGSIGGTTVVSNSNASGSPVTGYQRTGGFAGAVFGSSDTDAAPLIADSTSSAHVSADNRVGGFVGYAQCSISFQDDSATGEVTASDWDSGGFVGLAECGNNAPGPTFERSFATGDVHGVNSAGGFVGEGATVTIHKAYATGNVYSNSASVGGFGGFIYGNVDNFASVSLAFSTGDVIGAHTYVGGFAGSLDHTEVRDSYSRGDVTSDDFTGGFTYGLEATNIESTYATGQLDVDSGIVGGYNAVNNDSSVITSFWDTDTSGVNTSEDGTGLSTQDMNDIDTFTADLDESAWDFEGIWAINEVDNDGYPCLQWSIASCTSLFSDGDGVEDDLENAAPNDGDGNGDGEADSLQANVASVPNPLTDNYVTLQVSDDCLIESFDVNEESHYDTSDSGYNYPLGLLDFHLQCDGPSTDVAYIYHDYTAVAPFVVKKLNNVTDEYFVIDSAQVAIAPAFEGGPDSTIVTYTIVDNGPLDENEDPGSIVDPSGLAIAAPAAVTTTTQVIPAPGSNSASGSLPATGDDTHNDVGIALALILAGLACTQYGKAKRTLTRLRS